MSKEAIILSGGLGTRLRTVVTDIPKCMAMVAGKPFLHYVISHLQKQGIEKFTFALGYKHKMIESWLTTQYPNLWIRFSVEEMQLGTGGAIKQACNNFTEENVVVVNGDTLFSIEISKLSEIHSLNEADCTLSLKPMKNFNRYGLVAINPDLSIAAFKEKQYYENGLINGGVYMLNAPKFLKEELPGIFSFEKDYLEKYIDRRRMYGVVQDEYFIDIGIPDDFKKAQLELAGIH